VDLWASYCTWYSSGHVPGTVYCTVEYCTVMYDVLYRTVLYSTVRAATPAAAGRLNHNAQLMEDLSGEAHMEELLFHLSEG
jgi:hypothetical protein